MMGILQTVLLALIMGLLATTPAWAHKPSDSYLKLSGGDEQLSIQWDIAIKDLEFLIGLDSDQNGDITWGELKASESTIAAHALSRLSISANDQRYKLELS